jgi:hypothetical protein
MNKDAASEMPVAAHLGAMQPVTVQSAAREAPRLLKNYLANRIAASFTTPRSN